jgi:hypothetical protein
MGDLSGKNSPFQHILATLNANLMVVDLDHIDD